MTSRVVLVVTSVPDGVQLFSTREHSRPSVVRLTGSHLVLWSRKFEKKYIVSPPSVPCGCQWRQSALTGTPSRKKLRREKEQDLIRQ